MCFSFGLDIVYFTSFVMRAANPSILLPSLSILLLFMPVGIRIPITF